MLRIYARSFQWSGRFRAMLLHHDKFYVTMALKIYTSERIWPNSLLICSILFTWLIVFHKTAEQRITLKTQCIFYAAFWHNHRFSVLKENNERGLPLPLHICKARKKDLNKDLYILTCIDIYVRTQKRNYIFV